MVGTGDKGGQTIPKVEKIANYRSSAIQLWFYRYCMGRKKIYKPSRDIVGNLMSFREPLKAQHNHSYHLSTGGFQPVMLQLLGDQARPSQAAEARKARGGETIQVKVFTSQSIHRVLVNSS